MKERRSFPGTLFYLFCYIQLFSSALLANEKYVFFSDYSSGHTISRCNVDGSGYLPLRPRDSYQYTGYVGEIAVDNENQMVYWNSWSEIRRCSFDGSNYETVPISTEYSLGGIAIGGGRLYWTQDAVIKSSNLDNLDPRELIDGLYRCFSLTYDNVNNKLYYIGYEDNTWDYGNIYSANPDGTDVQKVVSDIGMCVGIAIHPYQEKLYWTSRDGGYDSVKSANLDGTEIVDLITEQQNPLVNVVQHLDIDIVDNKLYWADQAGSGKIQRMNLDGTGYEVIRYGNAPYGIAVSVPEPCTVLLFALGGLAFRFKQTVSR